jgi:hypothetical protein
LDYEAATIRIGRASWKTFRSKLNAIPPGDSKLFAFPPESVFIFRPECCSDS